MWKVVTQWVIGDMWYKDVGRGDYGPFRSYPEAAQCVLALAARETIISAIIEEVDDGE